MSDITELSRDDLELATGGRAQQQSSNPFASFFDSLYHGFINNFAGHIGGTKLAEKMYGSHVTAKDKSRAQTAMTKFLHDGHKLPKGVPNIFGGH